MRPLAADAYAVALLLHDVALVTDDELDSPTPCIGWTVRDLLDHLNSQHRAILASLGAAAPSAGDIRTETVLVAATWLATFADATDSRPVAVPYVAQAVPRAQLLAVHALDMVAHRWDLAVALGREVPVPLVLLEAVLPVAERVTAPGSQLNGPGGGYAPPVEIPGDAPRLERIVALLGRDPRAQGPGRDQPAAGT